MAPQPPAIVPTAAVPTARAPPKRNPNAPGWAQGDEEGGDGGALSGRNPGGSIRGGKTNLNVPVFAGENLPGALMPLWSVILICFGIIIILSCCCWCSVKTHGAFLNRQHRRDNKRTAKESDIQIARLNTEIQAMKALAKEQADRENEENQIRNQAKPARTNTVRASETIQASIPDQVKVTPR